MAFWIAAFGLGLYFAPRTNIIELMAESFFNALIFYFFFWGIAGLARRGVGRKAVAVILLMFLIGVAYENQQTTLSYVSLSAMNEVYVSENTYLATLASPTTPSPGSTSATFSAPPANTQAQTTSSTGGGGLFGNIGNAINGAIGSLSYPSFTPANPSFVGGRATVTYPSNSTLFANYALSVINKDRAAFGASPLTLSSVGSAQQHADSMQYFNYFEHVDNQGYGPQQRYEMLGGSAGLIGENQGQDYCTTSSNDSVEVYPASCNIQTIESGIANSEWGMMYNDVACCNNGHRTNILDSSYTQVAIGVAYDSTNSILYFVEDFYGPCPAGYICG